MLVAQLADNQFLVTGYDCRIDFRPTGTEQQRKSQHIIPGTDETPSALIDGKWQHRQFMRVEQGICENGVFKLLRSRTGDATDYGLRFDEEPTVLRVTLGHLLERSREFLFPFPSAESAPQATSAG